MKLFSRKWGRDRFEQYISAMSAVAAIEEANLPSLRQVEDSLIATRERIRKHQRRGRDIPLRLLSQESELVFQMAEIKNSRSLCHHLGCRNPLKDSAQPHWNWGWCPEHV